MIFKPVDSLAKIISGQSPESSTYNSAGKGLPFFQGKADFQDMYPTVRMWCTSEKRKEAEPNDILISVRAPVGAVNICNRKSIIGRGLAAIRPFSELDGRFLYYFLKANERQIDALGTGSTFKAITQDTLKNIQIPVPLLDDQIRIAHLLGKVEGMIVQRKQHLQQLDELLKSVFLEMFGDPVQNERGWDTKTLPQLVQPGKNSLKRGPFGGALKKEIFVETGYLVYEQNHALNNDYSFARYFVTEEKYQELIDFKVVPGDVLISCSGVYLGKLSIVPADAMPGIINQALLKVSLDLNKIEYRFFVHVFGSPQFKGKYFPSNRGGAIPNLPPMSVMKGIPFIYPPVKLQQDFSDIYKKVEALKSQYQQSLTDLEALYGALSQKAFKGDLDLSRVLIPKSGLVIAPTKLDERLTEKKLTDPVEPLTGDSFNSWVFEDFLRARAGKIYSTQSLWTELQQASYENPPPHFEAFKQLILRYLERGDWFDQVYEKDEANYKTNVDERRVCLRIRNGS